MDLPKEKTPTPFERFVQMIARVPKHEVDEAAATQDAPKKIRSSKKLSENQ